MPSTPPVRPSMMTVTEVAEYLNISTRQVRDLVYRRVIPFTKVGRLLRFPLADVEAYVEAHTVRPGSKA